MSGGHWSWSWSSFATTLCCHHYVSLDKDEGSWCFYVLQVGLNLSWCLGKYGVQCPPKFNFWILLVFLAFDVVVLQFVPTSAIEHSSFQFLYSNCRFDIVCFTIQLCSLKYSTFKFTQFNIQVYAIQHSTFENACFWYPTASQSMTVSVGSAN